MKITVLMGGTSAERDVSLATGREIARALRSKGHEVVPIDAAGGRPIPESGAVDAGGIGREPPDSGELSRLADGQLACRLEELPEFQGTAAIFVALHGGAGEDGRVQAILDLMRIPYTGSGPLGSALAMDKLVSKELFRHAGIRTPPWLVGPVETAAVMSEFGGYPVVVKPSREGSTVGVSVVRDEEQLHGALARASSYAGPPLIEKFIAGREVAVGVLGDEALPIVEIRPRHEIYDYECKYTKGMSEYHVPAPLSRECTEELQELAVAAHRVLGCGPTVASTSASTRGPTLVSGSEFSAGDDGDQPASEGRGSSRRGVRRSLRADRAAGHRGARLAELVRIAGSAVRAREQTVRRERNVRGRFGFSYRLTPWVKRLIIANVAVFLLGELLAPGCPERVRRLLAFDPAKVLTRPWTIITYMFAHGGILHILLNMLFLFFFGPPLEERWGGKEFIKYYSLRCRSGTV